MLQDPGKEIYDVIRWFGSRKKIFNVHFRNIRGQRDDFMEDPPNKFFRLAPGREVRLRYAYFVTCTDVVKDASGEIVELRCNYDPETRGGDAPDGRRPKATLHWLSSEHAVAAEVRLYDRLFTRPDPGADGESADEGQRRMATEAGPERITDLDDVPGPVGVAPGDAVVLGDHR